MSSQLFGVRRRSPISSQASTPETTASDGEVYTPQPETSNNRVPVLITLILIGLGVSAAFISFGIKNVKKDNSLRFEKQASVLVKAIEATWKDYELAGLWIHEACRSTHVNQWSTNTPNRTSDNTFSICSRQGFQELYDYVIAGGLKVKSISYVPNVTHQFREELEQEGVAYFRQNHPDIKYRGFVGFEPNPASPTGFSPGYRSQQLFYFPQHLILPIQGNEFLIGFDLYSSARSELVDKALSGWSPILSAFIEAQPPMPGENYFLLLHPGVPVSTSHYNRSSGLASVSIRFSEFIERAVSNLDPVSVYIYDHTNDKEGLYYGAFWGGVHVDSTSNGTMTFTYTGKVNYTDIVSEHKMHITMRIPIQHQTWGILVVPRAGTYEEHYAFVYLGGALTFLAFVCLALWFHTRMGREKKIADIKRTAEAEKAALVIESARKAAATERELNDYIAHEVRNPLTAAISACSFLSSTHHENPRTFGKDETDQDLVSEDIGVINSSLQYINDLLRSMLDMHKAANHQMTLEFTLTDILEDIFHPVRAILHRRDNNFDIEIDCPEHLVVMADRMRLKQIVLNLSANSKKFVQNGYIRLVAAVVDEKVDVYVEDSGPGIPKEKRPKLFSRFQESLDSLNQGTGMGLSLCKNLVELMDGEILLDESFDSGVPGCKGARFIIHLNTPPIQLDTIDFDKFESSHQFSLGASDHPGGSQCSSEFSTGTPVVPLGDGSLHQKEPQLPENLNVLVVDDDLVLRKLLSRSLRRVAPNWTIQEASNGETALRLAESNDFDLIFLDQYMASFEKSLLGSETAHALRAMGVTSRICGLSANDLKSVFIESGADNFLLKPFACEKDALTRDLVTVLGLHADDDSHV